MSILNIFERKMQCCDKNLAIVILALCCAVLPLETSQLIAALLGAAGYVGLQMLQPSVKRASDGKPRKATSVSPITSVWTPRPKVGRRDGPAPAARQRASFTQATPAVKATPLVKATVAPVTAPVFRCSGMDAEVNELLGQISASTKSEEVVAQIAGSVEKAISRIVPEAHVAGYACGNALSGAAFGVAVPEVDVIVSVNPGMLARALQVRTSAASGLDVRKLQKSAIRAITDQLVKTGYFKFRRSAFRGEEPKVTLIAQAMVAKRETNIPINISVNAVTPMYAAALVAECGQKDRRAKELILLVRRWAKDRGLSHVAKGYLSPYAWTLMTIYFLQVHGGKAASLLPALNEFKVLSGLTSGVRNNNAMVAAVNSRQVDPDDRRSVATLFQEFLRFYTREFGWQNEAVAVRLGCRAAPDVSLPLHVILHESGKGRDVGPSIEDPFERGVNLGSCTTVESIARIREEFERADELCSRSASLSLLLEPWAPPATTDFKEQDLSA